MHGIDLSLMWGTLERTADGRPVRVRQVCLAVPGSGKTAALVISGPGSEGHLERVSALNAACAELPRAEQIGGRIVRLAQALPEPSESWAVQAYLDAGFSKVGDLIYMRRAMSEPFAEPPASWPAGVQVRQVSSLDADRALLVSALDRSYERTLDCPELCGLRETGDVLESHRATGVFDPKLWWIAFLDGQPHGCILMARAPEQHSVELVYLGLSPELRGRGVGTGLLRQSLAQVALVDAEFVACAVDDRNAPALRLYERHGFREFGRRVALVRPL
jgi:ribosomal protein S18 acetylase RimI-like enzyme